MILNYSSEIIKKNIEKDIINDKSSGFYVDLPKEYKSKNKENRQYPLFISNYENSVYYIIPLIGSGLWGPIWGYIAIDSDFNVKGAVFDHKTETPGLGAEIRYEKFHKQFIGKNILDSNDMFQSIKVVKGGAKPNDLHGVDAVTGGTITSDGVTEMLDRILRIYVSYIKNDN